MAFLQRKIQARREMLVFTAPIEGKRANIPTVPQGKTLIQI